MKIMVLYNQSSGKDEGKKIAEDFQEYAAQNQPNHEVLLQPTGPDIEPEVYTKRAKSENVDTLVIIGGDGTIHHTVKAFEDDIQHYHLGLIPGGTVNNFARALRIPARYEEAFAVIFEENLESFDYGKVNDEVLISTLTLGILADTAASITQKDKQKYGPLIFIKNFFKMLVKKKRYLLDIETDDKKWQQKGQLLAVTMTNSVGGFTNFDATATPDDGLFHLTILPRLHFWPFIKYLPKVLSGRIYEIPAVQYYHTHKLIIDSPNKKMKIRIDGDPAGELPLKMSVMTHKLQIFVPEVSKWKASQ